MPTTLIPPWLKTLLEELGQIAAGVGAVFGGLVVAHRKVYRPVRAWMRLRAEQMELLRQVAAELQPNHGASLRDAVDRITSAVDRMESRQVAVEERWRIIHMDHQHGIVECDSRGALTWANRTFRELTGLDSEQLAGWGWANAMVPEIREQVLEEWRDAVEGGRDWLGRVVNERPDGSRICVKVRATRLEGGGYVAIVEPCPSMIDGAPCGQCYLGEQLKVKR